MKIQIQMQEGTQTGVVTYFCKSRGHGFIQPSDYQVSSSSSSLPSSLSSPLSSSLLSSSWPRSDLQRGVCCCLTMDIGNPIIARQHWLLCVHHQQNIEIEQISFGNSIIGVGCLVCSVPVHKTHQT